jgi:c-di-GMP-binding flagellar brake protein YcgR
MIIVCQLLIVAVLVMVIVALSGEEFRARKLRIPRGELAGFWGGHERRETVRLFQGLEVRYRVKEHAHANTPGHGRDISTGGVRLVTHERISQGSALAVEITLPGRKEAFAADGEVVWTKELPSQDPEGRRVFEVGLQFIDLKPKDENFLSDYIKGILSKKSG